MRLLFVGIHPANQSPGQRYRFEQYLPALEAAGVEVTYRSILKDDDPRTLQGAAGPARKAILAARTFARRSRHLSQDLLQRRFDVAFIQREAYFMGPELFEWLIAQAKLPYVYDFDDAIFIRRVSEQNRRLAWLRSTSKIGRLIRRAAVTMAGNGFLAEFARQHSSRVELVPTVVDTDRYQPAPVRQEGQVVVGWSGSFSTAPSLVRIVPALRRVKTRLGDRVTFRALGAPDLRDESADLIGVRWRAESEVAELQRMDIGLMPLEDDRWSKGKCGLKALLYGATGIPAVVSPVGVNPDVVQHGETGWLAKTEAEWEQRIVELVESAEKRRALGHAGRRWVENHYSVHRWAPDVVRILQECADVRKGR